MKVGRQARKDAKALFNACLNNKGGLTETRVKKVVKALLGDKPRGYLAILTHFHKLVRLKLAENTATVTTADQLTEEQAGEIQKSISEKYGKDLKFQLKVDPKLIGGARIQIGSDVFDASIKARLDKLRQAF